MIGRATRELLPLKPLRSRSMVTLPFSTMIFWNVPVGASVGRRSLSLWQALHIRCGLR